MTTKTDLDSYLPPLTFADLETRPRHIRRHFGGLYDTDSEKPNVEHDRAIIRYFGTDQDVSVHHEGRFINIGSPTTVGTITSQDDIDGIRLRGVYYLHSPIDTKSYVVEEPQELQDAIQELNELSEEAIEYDIQMPPSDVSESAERLLKSMYSVLPIRPVVELLSDSSIAIRMMGPIGNSVTTIVEANGETIVIVRLNGKTDRRAWYSESTSLIDGFIEDALNSLRKASLSAAK